MAVRAARLGDTVRLPRMIALTLLLGLGFCAVQSMIWNDLVQDGLTIRSSQLGSNFFCLTVLHVVHVLGGIAYLGVTLRDAFKRRFTAEDHERVPNCMVYWHFVGVLWYALFAALYLV
jgi:heme/copper-type cytochrome/quinol oxidase subunit 3